MGIARAFSVSVLVGLFALAPGAPRAQERRAPDEIAGLKAWYRTESLRGKLGEKGAVDRWPDASVAGHDLVRSGGAKAGAMRDDQIDGQDAVVIDAGFFDVTDPFSLEDHTLFIVSRIKYTDQAWFSGAESKQAGVLLLKGGREHQLRVGGVGSRAPSYSDPLERRDELTVTVLGRGDGVLRAWDDGADISSWARATERLEVGALFRLQLSQFADRDARGLLVAEMLFYDRLLDDDERGAVLQYLADRFGLALREASAMALADRMERLAATKGARLARLRPDDPGNLNDPDGHRIAWGGLELADEAFRHDKGESGETASRIYCSRDGTRAHVFLSIPVAAAGPGVRIRALLLRNGLEYLTDDAETPALGGEAGPGSATLELETTIALDDGDYFEVLTFATAAPGSVRLEPEGAGLILELR